MTAVKVCGLKDAETARGAWRLGADYLGLVVTRSSRQVTIEDARAIAEAVPEAQFVAVGHGVDESLFDSMLGLPVAGIQLHGPTPAGWIARAKAHGKLVIATTLQEDADVVLLDGAVPGSGQAWAWNKPAFARPIWLAGGLTPYNVRRVVRELQPDGVDVSSGVEDHGQKSIDLIRLFIQEVQYGDNASA